MNTRRVVSVAVRYLLLVLVAITTVTPFFWMVSSSLKERSKIFAYPPQFIPKPVVWRNYVEAWTTVPFGRFTLNTLKIAFLVVAGRLVICSLGGYGFARFDFPLKSVLFSMLLGVMMVPGITNTIPLFWMYKRLGWLDTHWSLIVYPAVANTFGTFLFRQFMMAIPRELEDAARIDGAGPFGIYWRVMMPLCKPAAAVLAIFTFISSWNAFFQPLVFLRSVEKMTINVGLAYFQGESSTDWHLLMAGSCITLVPTILVFLFTQRYFLRGVVLSGLKG